jgi:hypothetical protein
LQDDYTWQAIKEPRTMILLKFEGNLADFAEITLVAF